MVTESVCLFSRNFDQLVRAIDMYDFGLFIAEKNILQQKANEKNNFATVIN